MTRNLELFYKDPDSKDEGTLDLPECPLDQFQNVCTCGENKSTHS